MRGSDATEALVVDLTDVPFMDTSAAMALEEEIVGLRDGGDTVILFGLRAAVIDTLRRTGVLDQLSPGQISASRHEALQAAEHHIRNSGGIAAPAAR